MRRIGILGGGQLGLMLAEAVSRLGAEPRVLDPDPASPCTLRVPATIVAHFDDPLAVGRLADACDVLTYEFENVPSAALRTLGATPPLQPALEVLETCQDRIREKRFLQKEGLPSVRFAAVGPDDDAAGAAAGIGFPLVVKTARGGYDGKGQHRVGTPDALAAIPDPRPWVLEEAIAIETELSCIVARDASGREVTFPIFENLHRHHVLDVTLVPARIPQATQEQAREVALAAARALGVVGLLTVEFFLGRSPARPEGAPPELFVNEMAPRPHNSGHVTRNACTLSQYDALARVLMGAPLVEPTLLGPGAFCMGNLLGEVWESQGTDALDLGAWERHPSVVEVFLYGKQPPRPRRKMGHYVVHARDAATALSEALAFREDLAGRGRRLWAQRDA